MAAKKPTGQLNTWEAKMAESAQIAAKAEIKHIERPYFKTSGQLSFGGAAMPHGAAVIVLDHIHTNLYYEGAYDPNKVEAPDCFALGRDVVDPKTGDVVIEGIDTWDGRKAMAPHKDVVNRIHDQCEGCPFNEWASATRGNPKGKACSNARRAAVIAGGTMGAGGKFTPFTKPDQIEGAQLAYLKIAPTFAAGFSKLVLDTSQALGRPIWAMFTHLSVVPNVPGKLPASVLQFEALEEIPNALMDAVYKRYQKAPAMNTFSFGAKVATAGAAKGAGKPAGKRKYT